MIQIRPLQESDLPTVVQQSRDVAGGDAREAAWFRTHETLVAVEGQEVVGHTSWTPCDGYTLWDETVVAPAHRGQGIGRVLMDARAERTPGRVFGACRPDNAPMVHLLETLGFARVQTVERGYDGHPAWIWERA